MQQYLYDPAVWVGIIAFIGWIVAFSLINKKTVDKKAPERLDPEKELKQLSALLFRLQTENKVRLITDGKFQWEVGRHVVEYNTEHPATSLKIDNQAATLSEVYVLVLSQTK